MARLDRKLFKDSIQTLRKRTDTLTEEIEQVREEINKTTDEHVIQWLNKQILHKKDQIDRIYYAINYLKGIKK